MRLTEYELQLFIGYLRSRQMYSSSPQGGFLHDWEARTLGKLINELYISYGSVPNWK